MQKSESGKAFVEADKKEGEAVGEGVRFKVIGYNERIMLAKVEFQQGSVGGGTSASPFPGCPRRERGIFEVEIGGEKRVLKRGDVFLAPFNVPHGVVCLESGVLIDVFTPTAGGFSSAVGGLFSMYCFLL